MRYDSRRHELWTLVASIYYFLVYLAAFIIEILLIVDLAKRGDVPMITGPMEFVDKVKSQLALTCFALAILYFTVFIASLLPIVALIMRSSLCIIVWLYLMTLLYLPEFLLIIYVSVFEWGTGTRTGQLELIFYVIRAIMNVLFLFKANQLYRSWKYEKNFFKFDSIGQHRNYLPTGPSAASTATAINSNSLNNHNAITTGYTGYSLGAYDSPYFIGGANFDSLINTHTINPMYSSYGNNYHIGGTLPHINYRSHYYRDNNNQQQYLNSTYGHQQLNFNDNNFMANEEQAAIQAMDEASASFGPQTVNVHYLPDYDLSEQQHLETINNSDLQQNQNQDQQQQQQTIQDNNIYKRQTNNTNQGTNPSRRFSSAQYQSYGIASATSPSNYKDQIGGNGGMDKLNRALSVHSLDLIHQQNLINDSPIIVSDQIVLRPLTHRPFDYLQRPGSTLDISPTNSATTAMVYNNNNNGNINNSHQTLYSRSLNNNNNDNNDNILKTYNDRISRYYR